MVEAVIFDMDGLLLDTEQMAKRAWFQVFQEFGADVTEEQYFLIVGRNIAEGNVILAELLGEDIPVADCQKRADEIYHADIEENGIPVKPGAFELLDYLEGVSMKVAVATSTARKLATRKLEMTGLAPYFKVIVPGDEIRNGKPHPEIFLTAAKKLGVTPANCIILEDSIFGIRAAHSANAMPIMVPDLIQPDEEIRRLVHAVVPSLHEAREVISELLKA